MSGQQVLISVRFHGYYLELLVANDSTINQLVQAMRDNSFIPRNIQNSRLIFKKGSGEQVKGEMKVTSLVEKIDNTMHYLVVQVQAESTISQESGTDFFQSQTNKLLERIIRYLKSGTIDTLLKAKDNQKLQAKMAGHLTTIGQIFLQQKNLIQFFTTSLKALAQNQQSTMDELFSQFADRVKNDYFKIVKEVSDVVKALNGKVTLMEESDKNLKAIINKKNDELGQTNKMILKQKTKLSQIQDHLNQKNSKINQLNDEIEHLNQQIIKNKSSAEKIKQEFQISKKFGDQLTIQLKQEKDILFTKEKQLLKSANKIKQLNDIIAEKDKLINQKNQLLIQKNDQIQKIKENSIDEQILKYTNELQKVPTGLQALQKDRLENILEQKELVDQLKFTIESEMKKEILQIEELLSYDIGEHSNYCLKQNFQSLIHEKRSLLLIAIPQDEKGKVFGAFTEQKYDKSPSSYFIPEFNGCSFLFSWIKKQLRHFKIRDGQNSIMFDLENLVFGSDDLVVDFEKNVCTSKFIEGRSMAYNIYTSIKGQEKKEEDYRFLLSDDQRCLREKKVVKLKRYKIYELKFKKGKK